MLVTLLLRFRKTKFQIPVISLTELTGDLWCYSVPPDNTRIISALFCDKTQLKMVV